MDVFGSWRVKLYISSTKNDFYDRTRKEKEKMEKIKCQTRKGLEFSGFTMWSFLQFVGGRRGKGGGGGGGGKERGKGQGGSPVNVSPSFIG